MVKIVLPKGLSHPRVITDMLRRFVGGNHGLTQGLCLLFGRLELNLCYQFHRCMTARFVKYGKFRKAWMYIQADYGLPSYIPIDFGVSSVER
jgi:hypothetical protein